MCSCLLLHLMTDMVSELVAAPSYAATEASLHFELKASELGLRVMVCGLHERLPRLFSLLLDHFAALAVPDSRNSSSSSTDASIASTATRPNDAELRGYFQKHLENRLKTYFNTALRPESLE